MEQACDLVGAYQVDIVPHIETYFDALGQVQQAENLEQMKSGLADIDRAGNALLQIDPHPVTKNLHARLIAAFEELVEATAVLQAKIDGVPVSKARDNRAEVLLNRAQDDIRSVLATLVELNQTCEQSTQNATSTVTPNTMPLAEANSSAPSTACDLARVHAYFEKVSPILEEMLGAMPKNR